MADPTIRVNILGDNSDLRRATQGASRDLGKFGKFAGGALAGVGGAIAGIATISFAKGLIDDARESAKVMRITRNVIKTTGKSANISAEQVGELAEQISNVTGADDEAIQSGANMLLTFTGIRNEVGKNNDIFNQAAAMTADMAAAMNNGDVTASGLKTSSIQLGKALNDPIKGVSALSKVGVTFTDQQKKTIKSLVDSGKTMDAQKEILKELGKEFGGTAKASADPFKKFETAVGNLREEIGGKLLPIATDLVKFATDKLIPRIGDVVEKFDEAAGKVGDFVGSVRDKLGGIDLPSFDLGAMFDSTKVDVSGIGTSLMEDAKSWAGDLITGVQEGFDTGDWSGLGKSIGEGLAAALESAGDLATTFFTWIGDQIGKVDWVGLGIKFGQQVPSLLIGLVTGILTFDLEGLLSGLANNWQAVLLGVLTLAFAPAKLVGAVGKLLTKIPLVGTLLNWLFRGAVRLSKGAVSLAGRVISGFGKGMLDGIRRFFPQFGSALGRGVSTAITNLRSRAAGFLMVAQGWGAAILRALAGLPGQLGQWAGKAVGMLLGALGRGLPRILSFFTTLPGKILLAIGGLGALLITKGKDLIEGLKNGVTQKAPEFYGWLAGLPGRAVSAIGNVAGSLLQKGKDFIGGLKDGIEAKAPEFYGWMAGLPGKALSALGDVGSTLLQAGKDLIQGFINGIGDMAGALTDKVGSVMGAAKDKVTGIFKFGSPSRVMIQYGKWFSEGFAIGIKSKTKDVVAATEKMVEKVKQKIADARSFAREIRDAFVEFGNVTSFETPESGGSFQTLLAEAKRRADQAKAFASGFAKLRKMGLNETTLRQIREAGVEGGLPVMQQIINGGGAAGIRDLNALTRQIGASGSLLGNREATRKYGFDPTRTEVVITVDGKSDEIVRALQKALRAEVRKKGPKAALGIAV